MPEYKQFPLADTAEGLTEAEILDWKVKPGDEVQVNQIVVEVETAKAAVELPIPWSGVITELHVEPGQVVEVGTNLLTIDVDPAGTGSGAAAEASVNGSSQQAAEEEMKPLVGSGAKETSSKRRRRKKTAGAGATTATDAAPSRPQEATTAAPAAASASGTLPVPQAQYVPLAKPPVRKLAKDLGIDLRTIVPSSGDVITRDAVQRAAAGAKTAEAPAGVNGTPVSVGARERRVPIKGVRRMTAEAMVSSAFTAPHGTEFLTVDVTAMMQLRERLK